MKPSENSGEGYTGAELAAWLQRVVGILHATGLAHALGGGCAVLLYGRRARTRDVDFFVVASPDAWQALPDTLAPTGLLVERKAAWHYRLWDAPKYADLILAEVPAQVEAVQAAVLRNLAGVDVRVMPPEHLVALKVLAGRPRDRRDVGEIVDEVPDLDPATIARLLAPFEVPWP